MMILETILSLGSAFVSRLQAETTVVAKVPTMLPVSSSYYDEQNKICLEPRLAEPRLLTPQASPLSPCGRGPGRGVARACIPQLAMPGGSSFAGLPSIPPDWRPDVADVVQMTKDLFQNSRTKIGLKFSAWTAELKNLPNVVGMDQDAEVCLALEFDREQKLALQSPILMKGLNFLSRYPIESIFLNQGRAYLMAFWDITDRITGGKLASLFPRGLIEPIAVNQVDWAKILAEPSEPSIASALFTALTENLSEANLETEFFYPTQTLDETRGICLPGRGKLGIAADVRLLKATIESGRWKELDFSGLGNFSFTYRQFPLDKIPLPPGFRIQHGVADVNLQYSAVTKQWQISLQHLRAALKLPADSPAPNLHFSGQLDLTLSAKNGLPLLEFKPKKLFVNAPEIILDDKDHGQLSGTLDGLISTSFDKVSGQLTVTDFKAQTKPGVFIKLADWTDEIDGSIQGKLGLTLPPDSPLQVDWNTKTDLIGRRSALQEGPTRDSPADGAHWQLKAATEGQVNLSGLNNISDPIQAIESAHLKVTDFQFKRADVKEAFFSAQVSGLAEFDYLPNDELVPTVQARWDLQGALELLGPVNLRMTHLNTGGVFGFDGVNRALFYSDLEVGTKNKNYLQIDELAITGQGESGRGQLAVDTNGLKIFDHPFTIEVTPIQVSSEQDSQNRKLTGATTIRVVSEQTFPFDASVGLNFELVNGQDFELGLHFGGKQTIGPVQFTRGDLLLNLSGVLPLQKITTAPNLEFHRLSLKTAQAFFAPGLARDVRVHGQWDWTESEPVNRADLQGVFLGNRVQLGLREKKPGEAELSYRITPKIFSVAGRKISSRLSGLVDVAPSRLIEDKSVTLRQGRLSAQIDDEPLASLDYKALLRYQPDEDRIYLKFLNVSRQKPELRLGPLAGPMGIISGGAHFTGTLFYDLNSRSVGATRFGLEQGQVQLEQEGDPKGDPKLLLEDLRLGGEQVRYSSRSKVATCGGRELCWFETKIFPAVLFPEFSDEEIQERSIRFYLDRIPLDVSAYRQFFLLPYLNHMKLDNGGKEP